MKYAYEIRDLDNSLEVYAVIVSDEGGLSTLIEDAIWDAKIEHEGDWTIDDIVEKINEQLNENHSFEYADTYNIYV